MVALETWAEADDQIIPPFEIIRPAPGPQVPLIFASPHSGRVYPPEMLAASGLDSETIRRSEDAFVDDLIVGAADHGVVVVNARFARAYVDVNREPYELDPAMFSDELPAFARGRSARVAAGLGAIARIVAEGQEIYSRKLTFAEAAGRIERVHRPYHAALAALIEETRAKFGCAVLIDWHSMPSGAAGGPDGRTWDIVLGDRFGAACSASVTHLLESRLRGCGYRVVRNVPYAGGYTTEYYGRPSRGVHTLQVEIDRGLYMDEASLAPSAAYAPFKAQLATIFASLRHADWTALA